MGHQPLIFRDRADAGQQLAAALPRFDAEDTIVAALPRGGVPVAAEICAANNLPLDLVLVREIGAPLKEIVNYRRVAPTYVFGAQITVAFDDGTGAHARIQPIRNRW